MPIWSEGLTVREREAARLRLGLCPGGPCTRQEAARLLGIDCEQVRALERSYEERLRARQGDDWREAVLVLAHESGDVGQDEMPPEAVALARAVLNDDRAAAFALIDCLNDLRGQLPEQTRRELWREFWSWAPVRLRKGLRHLGVASLVQLLGLSAEEVTTQKNVGRTTLSLLRGWLARRGLYLRGDTAELVARDAHTAQASAAYPKLSQV